MLVLNKILNTVELVDTPTFEVLQINDESETINKLMEAYSLSYSMATLLSAVFYMCPKLIVRHNEHVPTSELYKFTDMVAGVISGSNGLELTLGLKLDDINYYIVDYIDIRDSKVNFAVHRLKDSVADKQVTSILRPGLIDNILKDIC